MNRWRDTLALQWAVLLSAVVALPYLLQGAVSTGDMVWVRPDSLFRGDLWGSGHGGARPVPGDGIVAVVSTILGASFSQKLVVLIVLVAIGVVAAQMCIDGSISARVATVTIALINPVVLDAIVSGRWQILAGLAGCLLIVLGERRELWPVVALGLAATSVSPQTALVGVVVAMVVTWSVVFPLAMAALFSAPWWMSAALNQDLVMGERSWQVAPTAIGSVIAFGLVTVICVVQLGAGRLDNPVETNGIVVLSLITFVLVLMQTTAPGVLQSLTDAWEPLGLLMGGPAWAMVWVVAAVLWFGKGLDEVAAMIGGASGAVVTTPALILATLVVGIGAPVVSVPTLIIGADVGQESGQDLKDWQAIADAVDVDASRGVAGGSAVVVSDRAGRTAGEMALAQSTLRIRAVGRGGAATLAERGVGYVVVESDAEPSARVVLTRRNLARQEVLATSGPLTAYRLTPPASTSSAQSGAHDVGVFILTLAWIVSMSTACIVAVAATRALLRPRPRFPR